MSTRTIDQAKLDRIKKSLAEDAKAEGVTLGPWEANEVGPLSFDVDAHGMGVAYDARPQDADFIARARTTAPAMAKMLLDEILWLEDHIAKHPGPAHLIFLNRLASIVNGWPETI